MTVYNQQNKHTGGMGCTCTPITPIVMTVYEPPATKPSMTFTVYRPSITNVTLYTDPMRDWINLEVYIDNYISMAQLLAEFSYITRAILHGIESIFPPPSNSVHKDGKHPISEKKASKGAG
jgi:hypothetical protein